MNNRSPVKVLKTAAYVTKTLELFCTLSTAFTAVTAIWAICSAAKKISA